MVLHASHERYSIAATIQAVDDGRLVRTIVQDHLDAIKQLDPTLNAITTINVNALADAETLDKVKAAARGPLHGIPIVIKDQIETVGIPTAFGSKCCKTFIPQEDATLVKLLKDAGAVIIAKSTMPDWAASWFSTSSLSGTTQNPFDPTRDAGGSSSGSGAAVAAGMAVVGIGGDTGGSIRLPSSFCGLVGVRMTPGRISRVGMSALVTTQDTPGPMARSVEDAARILDVIVGFDEKDEYTSINALNPAGSFVDAIKDLSLEGKRIGVLRQAFGKHTGVNRVMKVTLNSIRSSGAELIDVEIPDLSHYNTFTSLYGTRSKSDINEFLASREKLKHLTVQAMHSSGNYHKALDLLDVIVQGPPDFEKDPELGAKLLAQSKFQRLTAGVFAKHKLDAIVYPTSQLPAPRTQDVLDGRWTCLTYPTNTIIASQLLFPAISLPAGKCYDDEVADSPELPVGLEILGLPLQEGRIMAIAASIEQNLLAA